MKLQKEDRHFIDRIGKRENPLLHNLKRNQSFDNFTKNVRVPTN
ncbi:hypothetical protein LEP1GSC179_0949 [Leptospira santarosai str. MOR084]|uniref:Uncharacterized protein n=1 Tax=Leptospira santarosai str. MOR084 TaxID=1049984 RepID=A0A0E2BJK6_9LEPT|nr:hypothetical protein LEP1GSC179_0949 [Leptospira santarosai str. MOR084]